MSAEKPQSTRSGRVVARRESSAGPLAENVHHVHAVVARPDGSILASVGEPHRLVLARSAAKPFQLIAPLLAATDAPRSEEIAIAAASHKGAPWQVSVIEAWLGRLGLEPRALLCGTHPPADDGERARLAAAGCEPGPLHHNCSGKHCAMLGLALSLGQDPRTYLRGDQAAQRRIRAVVETVAGGGRRAPLAWSVDGCSAPTPAMPLSRLAASFARLAAAGAGERVANGWALPADGPADSEPLAAEALDGAMAKVFDAMRTHAELVAGPGLLDTALMRSVEHLVAKRGAEGVEGLAIARSAEGPIGVAVKIEDGNGEARDTAILAILEQLRLLNPASRVALAPFIRMRRQNARGLVVGHYEPELDLSWTR